ncbi:MAG: hypothetical protein KDD19_16585 [Phaeodactylibacter sp.]|nr:hypothetical protein [Phaeodactylibacter sp.]MCB9053162.1 hypothetical protein [Lewinellaceae bacterium]
MNGNLFLIGQLIITLLTLGVISSLYYALSYSFHKLRLPALQREKLLQFITAGLALWLAILAVLGYMGYFYEPATTFLRLSLAFALPAGVAVLLLFSRFFGLIIRVMPIRWLAYFQACRIATELFFWMGMKGGYVPVQMTFEWLNYDIVVGITGLMAGFVFFGRGRYRRFEGILWNTFGIASLANALLLSLFSLPGPHRAFATVPDSAFLTLTPFIWLPGLIFPMALAAHIFSLKKLFGRRKRR